MDETLSWSFEWNLIVWTNWIIFHDTHFASWIISTLFFRNKNVKAVKEKFHRISLPLEKKFLMDFIWLKLSVKMTEFWRYCSYGVFIKHHVSFDLCYNNYFIDQSWNMEIRTTGIEITTGNRWKMVAIEKKQVRWILFIERKTLTIKTKWKGKNLENRKL